MICFSPDSATRTSYCVVGKDSKSLDCSVLHQNLVSLTMCVTNIAKRRNVALADASAMVSSTPSLISQRLMSNFMPLMMSNTTVAKPLSGTDPTYAPVETRFVPPCDSHNPVFQEQSFSCGVGGPSSDDKNRPKRRRKPQKPGKTAKQNERHFVVHNYHDHALDQDENDNDYEEDEGARRRGGVSISFPTKLHTVLEQVEADGWGHVISWQPHGRCFVIHKPKEFTELVMPHYFRQSKLTSFQRQLNLYGFCRLTRGKDSGGYYHELFLKGRLFLAQKMQRTKIKGTKFKAASSPDKEPDFYRMVSYSTIDQDDSCTFFPSHRRLISLCSWPQPPVLPMTAPVSDDSSVDGSAVIGRRSPQGFTTTKESIHTGPYPVSPTTVSIDPLSLQVPRTQLVPPMEPYPILNIGMAQGSHTIQSNHAQLAFNLMSFGNRSQADEILDQAVDELFKDANNMVDYTQDGDFEQIWDHTEFGEDSHEDDLELGFMLDKLLEN